MEKKLRIGLLNIMPEAEKYEKKILKLLIHHSIPVEIVLIRVNNHAYKSSDKNHLEKCYISFSKAIEKDTLDGLILTGAPVETMPFERITYWDELVDIFKYAQNNIISTMGVCWGGIAIGKYLGIENDILPEKLFGVFSAEYLLRNHWSYSNSNHEFNCPQSRYAGLNENELLNAENEGLLNLLVNSPEAGHFIFESSDKRFIAHLGHPEYDISRIVHEYERDQIKGLNHIPLHFDVHQPVNNWQQNSADFFGRWFQMINSKIQNV